MTTIDLQKEIIDIIYNDNQCSVVFSLPDNENTYKVCTYNPKHKTLFLLYEQKVSEISLIDFLKNVIKYLKNNYTNKTLNSYTVSWKNKQNIEIYKSYFYATDIEDLAHKFYSSKNKLDYIVYNIQLNPEC